MRSACALERGVQRRVAVPQREHGDAAGEVDIVAASLIPDARDPDARTGTNCAGTYV